MWANGKCSHLRLECNISDRESCTDVCALLRNARIVIKGQDRQNIDVFIKKKKDGLPVHLHHLFKWKLK